MQETQVRSLGQEDSLQVRRSGVPISLKNFPQFVTTNLEQIWNLEHIYTVKGFGAVNKAKVDVFLEFSCFLYDPMDVGNLISGSSAFSKTILNIWKFTVHVLLKPGWRILSITLLVCEMSAIVQ